MTERASLRPPPGERRFHSASVDALVARVQAEIADPELAWLFGNCLPNTLDTTVFAGRTPDGRPDTYVITGDIDAMWLRDSTAQVWPYLPLARDDGAVATMLAGVVGRQARCVLLDPYANAFYAEAKLGEWADDDTDMRPGVHERKWELDSLAAFLRLSQGYWRATGDTAPFDGEWRRAVGLTLDTAEREQDPARSPYRFRRTCDVPDSLPNAGRGDPARRCGLIRNAFRPSDDACKLPFLIPSNAMFAAALEGVAELLADLGETALAGRAGAMAAELRAAIDAHGVVEHPRHGRIWAYEVDGFGGAYSIDDANVPSLLSLPYLGFCDHDDPRYRRTRAFCLGDDNPYWASGRAGAGIGSPHTGAGTIWPIALTMQALTASDDQEIAGCLATLKATHAGTGFMHEGFAADDAGAFTRPWFAWANTLFGELILTLWRERPHLLARVHASLETAA